jgi:hypothetical protein
MSNHVEIEQKNSLQKNHLDTVTAVQNVHCTRHSNSVCSVLRQPIDCSHPQQRVFFLFYFFLAPVSTVFALHFFY